MIRVGNRSAYASWILIVAFGICLALWARLFLDGHQREMEKNFRQQATKEGVLIGALVQQILQRQDYHGVDGFIQRWGMEHDESVVELQVLSGNGFLLAHFSRPGVLSQGVTVTQDLSYSYRGHARLSMVKSMAAVEREHRAMRDRLLWAAFFVFVVFTFIVRNNTKRRLLAQNLLVQKEELVRAHADLQEEVAQRQLTQEALEREKEMLAVTLRSIGDGVITTDIEGKITLMNRVAERLCGWPLEAALGRALSEVFHILHETTRLPCPDPMEQVRRAGRAVTLEERTILVAKDGSERRIGDSAAPILDRTSAMIGAVLVFRDVTQEMRHRETIARAQKLESVGVLAGGIAHDFNNILTGILGNIYLAKTECAGAGPAGRLADAEKACQRARELTQQLITFAKGGAPVMGTVDTAPLLEEVLRLVLSGSSVTGALDVRPGIWPVTADGGQIHQVLHNLLLNAVQAMPAGGTVWLRAANVAPHAGQLRRMVRIEVEDEGGGIAATDMERIFDPYYSTKSGGHGLGLAVVHSIVVKHGGRIEVASVVGRGSCFSLLLPAAEGQEEKESPAPLGAPASRSGRILVMDDDDMARRVFVSLLQAKGYRVDAAVEGARAVAMYRQAMEEGDAFAVVIFDLTVRGGMGGVEALGHLRAVDSQARAIVTSGYSNDPVLAEHLSHGFAGRIAKPCRPDELYQVVEEVLAGPDVSG